MTDTEQIKQKLDIVDFISGYTELKPAGARHKGLCPFHSEKTPSFMASRDRQSWHCFGCNKGGDIFTFVQEIESMGFREALQMLAERAGIQLTQQQNPEAASQKARLRKLLSAAAGFYHNVLIQMEGAEQARQYLAGRGVSEKSQTLWQIGFVPDQWDLLTKYLLKKGHGIDDLVDAGLTIKKDGAHGPGRGFYDRFRGRIMFPIQDAHGTVVGFTGRLLQEQEGAGKYVNTPQTPMYDKSRVLFGLDKAKQAIKQEGYAVIVEGQMDVIASHQAGVLHTIASSGTALTEQQIALLKRYTNEIRMAFDGDAAGVKAAKRGIDLAVQAGMHVRVIELPPEAGKDPDDCIQKDPALWEQAIAQAAEVMDWYVRRAFEGKDLKNPRQKQAIASALLPEIQRIPFAIEQDHWMKLVAGKLGVDVSVLRKDADGLPQKQPAAQRAAQGKSEETKPAKPSKKQRLLDEFLVHFLAFPSKDLAWPLVEGDPLYERIKNAYTEASTISPEKLRATFEDEGLAARYAGLLMKADLLKEEVNEREGKTELSMLALKISAAIKKAKRMQLAAQINQAEQAGDQETLSALLQAFQNLSKE